MNTATGLWIAYDGECPFCSNYVRLVRLREAVGPVHLINGRDDHPFIKEVKEKGYSLDEGMIRFGDGYYYGADCINFLSLMSEDAGLLNRAMQRMFRSPQRAKALYPFMRAGRNLTLRALGREPIQPKG